MHVSTGQPAGAGQGGQPESPPGRSGGGSPTSVVDVAVEGAAPGDHVSIDVSPPGVEDDPVAFDGISVTLKRGGDVSMQVTNSREALPGSPDFEPSGAADALGRVRLDHSVSNEDIEDVSYTFRVSRGRLASADTKPENVALYRFADGSWSALPTKVVGETGDHYVFEARSPGMSEFAIGAKRPEFDAYWATVDQRATTAGEGLTVSGRISNVGSADGVYEASLVVDGEVVSTRDVTIAAGGTRQVNFRTHLDRPGTYQIAVDEADAGEVTVRAGSSGSAATAAARALPVTFDRLMDVGRSVGASIVSLAFG